MMEETSLKKYSFSLVALTTLFFMWGFITCLNDILIPYLKGVFDLSQFEATLVQLAFFFAYFVVSLIYFIVSATFGDPILKIGYKNTIVLGLFISSVACFLFYCEANSETPVFLVFLLALFLLGAGFTFLQIAANPFGTKVIPAWRPDKAMAIENPQAYKAYLLQLGEAAGMEIDSYRALCEALQKRHDFFASMGCKLSDHGMERFYAADYTEGEIESIFQKVLKGTAPSAADIEKFRSAFMFDQGVMDAEAGWAQQYHVGPIRNNNTKMFREAGPDTGYDAIHDLEIAADGHRFFDRLTLAGKLAKTILYCLNPKDNAVMMTLAYTFNDGTVPGKMQFGSGWWFLDQEVGMRRQLDSLSHLGLLSRFVGMLTDSRSFISYPRHEYFRRILCDVLGQDVEQGKLPASELDFIGKMVEDISYNNAKNYFNF